MQSESINWREALVLTVVAAALLGIGVTTAQAQWNHSARSLDKYQIGDLFACIQTIQANQDGKRKIGKADADLCGRGFFEYCFKHKLIETDMLKKCVSIRSLAGDEASDGKFAETGEGSMPQSACSFATPKMGVLWATLSKRGAERCVAMCFDSRNWLNGGKAGVLACWTDGELGDYLDSETAMKEYQVAAADFDDPGGKLFGKVAPFKNVFEEEACTKAAAKVREEIAKLPSFVEVFNKKGRSWKYKGTSDEKQAPMKEFQVSVKVIEVEGDVATWEGNFLDAEGKPVEKGPPAKTDTLDLTDRLDQRPPGVAATDLEEVEAAGRKWKCRKWTHKEGAVTNSTWVSIDVPGLIVKGEGRVNLILIEFNDPK